VNDRERLILIARAKQKQQQAAAQGQTNLIEQTGTGTSEGIANMAGMPVDLLTKGLNLIPGVNIQNPVGGSESIKRGLSPFMSKAEPQTTAQRIGRRVGQDVGAGAVAAPVAGVNSLAGLALNEGSNALSGLAGGAMSEVTDNPYANVLASLAGGSVLPSASYLSRGNGAPSIADLKGKASGLYKQVKKSDYRLTPEQTQELQGNISARMYAEDMDPSLDIRAKRGVDRFYALSDQSPDGSTKLNDLEKGRRFVGRKVIPSEEPGEQALGMAMRDEFDKYIDKLAASPNPPEDVLALKEARATTRRYKAAETVEKAFDKADLRASSTGIGGNDINAIRQNFRAILDSPKKAAGFNAEELVAMRRLVKGTRAANTARMLGAFAPQRGMFPGGFALAQTYAAGSTGNPIFMAPSAIGMVAQAIGEQITKKQAQNISALIRSGKPVDQALSAAERAVMAAVLSSQAAQQTQRSGPQ
jgi:hypothetical protein